MDAFRLSHLFMLNTNFLNPSFLCTLRSLSTNPHSSWFKVAAAVGKQKNNNNKTFDATAFEVESWPMEAWQAMAEATDPKAWIKEEESRRKG